MGLSQQTALDTASLYGDMGTGMGLTTKRAAEMSMRLTQLSADLSSYKNMSQDITKNALKGIFTGETEALKNLGTVMTQTDLEGYAKTLGITKKFKDMTQAEKVELRYGYVFDYNKNASGDFLRTIANFANQKRINEELQKQVKTNFGEILLPLYTKPLAQFNSFIRNNLNQITETFKKVVGYILNIIDSFKPVLNELKITFKLIFGDIKEEIKTLAPIFKKVIQNILVPTLTLTISAFNKVYQVISKTCDIIKSVFIPLLPILTGALTGLAVYKTVQFFQMLQVQLALLKMETGMGLVANLKVLTASIWKSVPAILAQTTALLANPLFWIPAVIAAAITAIVLLVKNWETINKHINNTKIFLSELVTKGLNALGTICNYIKNNFISAILSALTPINLIIKGFVLLKDMFNKYQAGGIFNLGKINLESPKINNSPPLLTNNYISNSAGTSGVIEVKNIIENKNNSLITSNVSLLQPNNLSLKPI